MKLATAVSLIALGLGAVSFVVVGCGGDDETGSGSAGAGRQPPAPTGAATPEQGERTFAITALQLGETDRAGVANKDAWKKFGYNLDGLASTRDSKDVCTPAPGASKANQEDGEEGIDNAFAKTILPLISSFANAPSKQLSDSIQNSGAFTIMMRVKGLTEEAAQTNTGLSGTILIGSNLNKKPDFSPTFEWPYRREPQVPITGAYITNGTFVNGAGGATIRLSLFFQGVALDLVVNKAIITFKHQPPNDIGEGTIAGVIGAEELIAGIERVAGGISEQLCGGSTLDSIKSTIRQASDILKDGTNKAGVPCDGISIGIGFTGKRIANPGAPAPDDTTPPEDLCNPNRDAGAGGDGG